MEKIFFANKSAFTTEAALKKIFSTYYGKDAVTILRTNNGKPYIDDAPHFSVTHTKDRLYIAFSDKEIRLRLKDGSLLSILGEGLRITSFDDKNGVFGAVGSFMGCKYKQSASSFIKKVLG